MQQKTIKNAVTAQGVGLHSGVLVTMTMSPAPSNTGIVFQRIDLPDQPFIPALWDRVVDTRLCTQIADDKGHSIGTIEHVMAAIRAANIDNLHITLDGPEVPIMDGSAEPFAFLLQCASVEIQNAKLQSIRILKIIRVDEGDKSVEFTPADMSVFDFTADFNHPAIGYQKRRLTLVNGNFPSEIARARTFGFVQEVDYLRQQGLIKGGSLDNAIVLDHEKILNAQGLRFEDEFVRHKILDAVGDLYLAGRPILGHYKGVKASHALNNKLLHALFADPTAFRYV